MLEYCKKILEKVSFDHRLFEKELIKSLNSLNETHQKELKIWCKNNFGNIYPEILEKYFGSKQSASKNFLHNYQ